MTQDATTPRFDMWSDDHRGDPHSLYHQMRSEAPVYEGIGPETGRRFWFLTRHQDVLDTFRDPRLGREVDRLPAHLQEQHRFPNEDMLAIVNTHMLNMDPPDHTRLRRLVSSAFTPKRVRDLEPRIRAITEGFLDGLDGEVDLIHDFALPIPVTVIAELLGVPIDDLDGFRAMVDGFLRAETEEAAMAAGMQMIQYINVSIEQKRKEPGDDLLSALIHLEEDGDRLSDIELTSMVNLLLIAGHETTVNLIGNGMLELMRHPDQMRRLVDDSDLIDLAIEEMVRFNGPVETPFPRIVYEDITVRGVDIPAGDMVIPVLAAANRDPEVFENADTFDIGRDSKQHVGFGFGVHFCLGAPLARLEARVAITALLDRNPDIALAVDDSDLEWNPGFFLRGVRRLPVRLTPGEVGTAQRT
jgi:cytochrome P450